MATQPRLKGQEVYVNILLDNKTEDRLGPFTDMDIALRKEVIEAEYLGATTTSFDSVFKGCQLNVKGHMRGAIWMKLYDADIRRARNIAEKAITRIDVVAVVVFPGGKIINYTFIDMTCGDHKISIPDRKTYVEGALEMYCSDQPDLPAI